MKTAKLGDLLMWKGVEYKVVSIAEGKVLYMEPVRGESCYGCGHKAEVSVLESSPLFQENAEPIPTISTPTRGE